MVAHKTPFDTEMLIREDIKPKYNICTLKLARQFYNRGVIPKYNLQYLRYFLNLHVKDRAYDTLGDISALEDVFKRIYIKAIMLLGNNAVKKIIETSNKPGLISKMPFGKHKGKKIENVPADYLQLLLTTDLDEDMDYTVKVVQFKGH